jgi:hypothetical protein
MFKKPEQIKPLPAGMADAFSRTLQRQGFVAPGQQPAQAPKELAESAMSELSAALRSMSDKDFQAEYKMTKAEMRAKLKQKNESVTEAVKEYGMPEDREDMSEGSPEYMVDKDGKTVPVKPKKTYAQMKADAAKKNPVAEAMDPVDPKKTARPLSAHKDQDINNDGKVDSSDQYLHKRRQAITKALKIQEETFAGWIAIYKGKKIEIKKDQAKDLYGAKQLAIKQLNVPKSGLGILAIKPAYESYAGIEEGWDDMLKAAKERNQPQPRGGAGKKQGTAYGGSKQKDAPAPKKEELHGDQHKLDKNKNGKLDKHDFKLLNKESVLDEEVKVGDKVSFDHPMTAAPGKTMKKVGTVKKIVGDTAHLKSSTKYGTLSYEKKVSELRKEEVEQIDELNKDTLYSYAQKANNDMSKKHKELTIQVRGNKPVEANKTSAKLSNRDQGLDRAEKRLNKEEVEQMDEAMLASHIGGSSMIVHHDLADHKERHKKVLSLHKNLTKLGYSTKSKEHLNIAHHEKTKDTVHGSKYDNKDVTYTHPSKPHKTMQYWTDHADRQGKRNHVVQVFNQPAKKANLPESVGLDERSLSTELAEAPNYKLYHTTFSAAVQEAIAVAKKQGYEVDEEDWQNKVATGPKKPSKDKTNSYSIDLTKNGSPTKKKLQIQVYNMGEKYELNTYVQ